MAELPALLAMLAAVLYVAGLRRPARGSSGARTKQIVLLRASSFIASLVTITVALASPVDGAADKLLWVHMIQHVLLLLVAPPLLVLGAPWMPLWLGLPLRVRRPLARAFVRSRPARPLRAVVTAVATPIGAFVAFNVDLLAWHAPALYDLTLRNQAVHDLEHTLFVATGILFWTQLLPSWPLHRRLDFAGRLVYTLLASLPSWLLAVVMAFYPSPLYSAYADLSSRPGGITALGDQRLAAGVMWVPGSIPFALAILFDVYRLLGRPAADRCRRVPRQAAAGGT
ncbi:MAG: cytochrome c oxidase assembly protein [Gaiellales bacterium]